MAETSTDSTISAARELQGPLQRARDVARQHSASSPDGGTGPGHHTTFWEGVGSAALNAEAAISPGFALGLHVYRNWPRYRHVLAALGMCGDEARQLMVAETGATVEAVIGGLLPGLLDIAKWVGLGAVIGGGIGALGGPAHEITAPGGALAGAEIGLWVANSLGLVGMVKNLGQFVVYASDAAEIARYAGDDGRVPVHSDEVTASKLFAAALAELWTALVAEVMKRAAEGVHGQLREGAPTREALNQISKKIGESKLGPKAGERFRNNFDKIREAVKKHQEQRQKRLEQGQDSGSDKTQFAVPPELKTSSGKAIRSTPGKTTTVLGPFGKGTPGNMDDIINKQCNTLRQRISGPRMVVIMFSTFRTSTTKIQISSGMSTVSRSLMMQLVGGQYLFGDATSTRVSV